MAWEKRKHSQHLYYTRSRRVRGRVVREYCGRGLLGQAFAAQDELDRGLRELQKMDLEEEEERAAGVEETCVELCDRVENLMHAALTAAGFYRHHRGEWRKRRGPK